MSGNKSLFSLFDSHGRKKNDDTANAPTKQACIEIQVLFLFVILLSKAVIRCAKGTKSGEKVFIKESLKNEVSYITILCVYCCKVLLPTQSVLGL